MTFYDINAGKICRCTGMHKYPKGKDESGITFQELLVHLEAKDLLAIAKDGKIGMVIEWWGERDQRPPGFDLKVTAAKTTEFSPDADQLVAVKEFGGVAQPRDKEFDKRRRLAHIGAGFFTLNDELKLECSFDSDNCLLLKGLADLEEKDRKTGERQLWRGKGFGSSAPFPFELKTKVENDRSLTTRLTVVLELQLYPQAKEGEARAATYYLRIHYTLVDLFPYDGFAAIDFGNSACSFAVKPLDSLDVESITLPYVDCENRDAPEDKRPPMLESAVYIKKYLDSDDTEASSFPPCEWVCGNLAMGKPDEMGLVVAPKRYLGKDEASQVLTQGREVSCHYPAELLFTSILREAHYQLKASVHSNVIRDQPVMTLTYPSSYSRHEIDRLERCYLAAVSRALPCQNVIPLDQTVRPRMLDEASAAAFYFLYRDFFYSAGRVPAFEYIYPYGANVLILDFGGGTTDVALVRCVPERNEEHPSTIRMDVLRRTGMRQFGGDNITQAVYRVVKTEVARFLTQSARGSRLGERAEGQSFDQWYAANEGPIDEAVPTKFVGLSEGEERTRRRKLTKAVWTWAEKIKKWLGDTNERFPRPVGEDDLDKFIREVAGTGRRGRVRPGQDDPDAAVSEWLEKTLPKQIVDRAHDIEEQVRPDLENLMRKVNHLLKTEFDGPDKATDESLELHRVYVVGRAAHFDLVRSIIADGLALQIVNHQGRQNEPDWVSDNDRDIRRFVFDRSESKNAIAKGALLYAFLRTNRFENDFVADERLRDRIPYDVLYDTTQTKSTIFKADSDYEVMQREWTPMPDLQIKEMDGERRVTLHRHWPGDDEGIDEAFFYFTISNAVAGPLKIQYEEGATYSGYVLRDFGGHDERIHGTWIESKDTVPPMQRGEL